MIDGRLSCHDHGNCELCDEIESELAAALAENARLHDVHLVAERLAYAERDQADAERALVVAKLETVEARLIAARAALDVWKHAHPTEACPMPSPRAHAELAVVEAARKLVEMAPTPPEAITYEQGWRLLDFVQDHLSVFVTCLAALDAAERGR